MLYEGYRRLGRLHDCMFLLGRGHGACLLAPGGVPRVAGSLNPRAASSAPPPSTLAPASNVANANQREIDPSTTTIAAVSIAVVLCESLLLPPTPATRTHFHQPFPCFWHRSTERCARTPPPPLAEGSLEASPTAWPPAMRTHPPPAISPLLPRNLVASFDNVVRYSACWLQGLTTNGVGLAVGLAGISSV